MERNKRERERESEIRKEKNKSVHVEAEGGHSEEEAMEGHEGGWKSACPMALGKLDFLSSAGRSRNFAKSLTRLRGSRVVLVSMEEARNERNRREKGTKEKRRGKKVPQKWRT